MRGATLACLLAFVAASGAVAAREPARALATGPAQLRLVVDATSLRSYGLQLRGGDGDAGRVVPMYAAPGIVVELGDGAPTAALDGALSIPAGLLRRGDGAASPPLFLVPARPGRGLELDLADRDGGVWLHVGTPMRSPDRADGFRVFTADLRGGPALSAFTGRDADDVLLGNVSLEATLSLVTPGPVAPKSCAAPNWPGTPGYVADVSLTDIGRIDFRRCRLSTDSACGTGTYGCDGPGNDDGEVVIVPDATLRNRLSADAADIPWYEKFTGLFAPYGNDQHPFLVWNAYRIDADGGLVQIGRSGLKHAFATANTQCLDPSCPSNGHILGRGCADVYNAGSNDLWNALGPRSEVIPSAGIWGRCGSVYDDVDASGSGPCDGAADSPSPPFNDCYSYRMVVRESEIDPAANPGATWLLDAMYVVRDDVDIFNTMGWRAFVPQWRPTAVPPRWVVTASGSFANGTVIDAWLAQAPPSEWTGRTLLANGEGHALVGVRVRRDGPGQYLYRYAVMNFDLTRPVTAGAEPNLQVVRNLGLDAFAVEGAHAATMAPTGFVDGDADAGNDWSGAATAAGAQWSAPGDAAELAWGQMMSFSLGSAHPPGTGEVSLRFAEAGTPATLVAAALAPDASGIFSSSFE